MSMSDTSRLIKESRRIVDASNDVNLNSGTLLNMIFEIVTGIDSTMRRMETSMEKRLDDLKQDFLTVSARVRTLENQASDVNKKLSDCETSCQGVSNLFDQVSGQVKTNRRNINNHDTRIKKLEDNTIVRPGVPPVINSKEIESLKAAILDLQCRSMKNNLIFTGLHRVPGEDTEELLRSFLYDELRIDYRIEFGNVHRFRTKGDNRRAPIVARFLYHHVIFGCVYVPPENSKYSTIEAFEELENELNILTNTENCYIALVGDFNSKTGLQATFSKSDSIVINNRNDKTFVRWKSEQKSEYVDRIHNDPEGILTTVMNKLDELSVNNDATQNDINNIVLDISKNFKDAAAETFGKINKHKHFYKHENSKPWFNRKCSMSRKKFHKARKRYSFLKNAENRSKMRQASKEHKITLNKAFANYQQRAADELRNISKKDTKALWKILNNLNDSKKKDNNDDISLKALYDHFKILNETVETENDFEQDLEFDTLSDDVELFLNSPVTEEDEIKKSCFKFKKWQSFR
ncbi:Hypothetical predicted protein [Mytilus galloprovincialis]|uniref:Endonuclease/exonuclease/phosphatase domain-containing protein n=1 Tax=Mytilus galloprovincialis TaxID=29158 RepID=A0A8B6F6N4_MYTGA|nr:Hypothetical predicted protein [Mytilus galloprovincialis]